jgi:hypothetical protein
MQQAPKEWPFVRRRRTHTRGSNAQHNQVLTRSSSAAPSNECHPPSGWPTSHALPCALSGQQATLCRVRSVACEQHQWIDSVCHQCQPGIHIDFWPQISAVRTEQQRHPNQIHCIPARSQPTGHALPCEISGLRVASANRLSVPCQPADANLAHTWPQAQVAAQAHAPAG